MKKLRNTIILLTLCLIIAVVPFGVCYSVSADESGITADYEVMRLANDTELSTNLINNMGAAGNVSEVTMKNHKGVSGNVMRFITEAGASSSMFQTFSSPKAGTYILSGWSKAQNVIRGIENEYYSYSLLASLVFTDGTSKDYSAIFSYGTHDWEYRKISFTANKPVSSLSVMVFLRAPASGTAYFDEISLKCADESTELATFNDLPVKVLKKATGEATKKTLKTADGLEMGLGDTQITELRIDGKSVISDAFSGFLVRDIASDEHTGIYSFAPNNSSQSDRFSGKQTTLGLGLKADFTAKDNCISVSGTITDSSKNSDGRAVQLSFALPVSASGWKWGTDILNETDITCGKVSNVYKTVGDGYLSVTDWDGEPHTYYPVTTVYNEELGIAIATDMDFPNYWQLEYNGSTNSYVLTYQLGIVEESSEAARFGFSIYKLDAPKWGFRSAMKKYSLIHPDYYVTNEKEHGLWLAWAQVDNVLNVEDFNIKFKEIGETTWTNGFEESQKGIKGYYYFELGDWWLSNLSVSDASGIWDKVHSLASEEIGNNITDLSERPKLQAIATEFCKNLDANGEISWNPVNNAWCPNGCQVHINANPALPGKYNFYNLWMNDALYDCLFNPLKSNGTTFNGIYLDELSGWWIGNANFNKEHYAYTTVPLTYSPYYRRPMLHRASTTWECVKKLSTDLHAEGKTIFANKCPDKNAFYVPLVDAMGTEQTALNGTMYAPQSISMLSTWRTLAYSKPFCILLSNDYSVFDHDMMEKYFARCLAYAIFPSPCMNDDGTYYFRSQHRFYERDRDVFQTYMPAIKACSEAGWEPVTYASSDDSELIIERYGDNDAEGIHYVIYNTADSDREISVKLDMSELSIGSGYTVKEIITGENITLDNDEYNAFIGAEDSLCICIKDLSKTDKEENKGDGTEDKENNPDEGKQHNNQNNSETGDTIGQSFLAMNKVNQTIGGGLINKIIKHHQTNNLEQHMNKETYSFTVVLIIVDALVFLTGTLLFILVRRKRIPFFKKSKNRK